MDTKKETPLAEFATFELRVLISLLNKHRLVGTTEDELRQLVAHVNGVRELTPVQYHDLAIITVEYVSELFPNVVKIADAVLENGLDKERYQFLLRTTKRDYQIKRIEQPVEVIKDFDWSAEALRTTAIKCRIKIRDNVNGGVKPSVKEALDGAIIDLIVMWQMDHDDPYPGEYALSSPDSCIELFEKSNKTLSWIASGDVEVIKQTADV